MTFDTIEGWFARAAAWHEQEAHRRKRSNPVGRQPERRRG